jgi:putative ABC transport system substrate-binding protein
LITRRSVLLTGGVGLIAAPLISSGQPKSKIPRVGVLWFGSMETPGAAQNRAVFRQQLTALGYVEGKNIVIEERSAEGDAERLVRFAREFAASKVDVIVSPAVTSSRAARQATRTIPIVMLHAGDPVGAGLIASLDRPGGNVTGTSNLSYAGKQIELMREIVPRASKLAILLNPSNSNAPRYVTEAMEVGRKGNLSIAVAEVSRAEDFPNALAMIRDIQPDALLVMADPFIGEHRTELYAFVASARLPTGYDFPNMARDGGLVAYGPRLSEHYVLAARYVDKILKGVKPADLPVEQPSRFELVVNLKTAKALGLTIPQSIVVRADEVIR